MPAVAVMPVGSPPRMRGKDGQHLADIGGRRITPACAGKRSASLMETVRLGDHPPAYAGKSHRACGVFAPVRDHPRVCGEKFAT